MASGRSYSADMIERVREMYDAGHGACETSRTLGIPLSTVTDWAKRYRWGSWQHRPTDEAVAEIQERAREMLAEGMTYPQISKAVGVSRWTVRNWRAKYGWTSPRTYRKLECDKCAHLAECKERVCQGLNCCCEELIEIEDVHESRLWSQNGGYGIADIGWT